MSFDLVVLAMDEHADAVAARAMVERCQSGNHVEGDLDGRVVGFYERLRASLPDNGPLAPDSPWMSTPLGTGIDHVFMNLSFSERSTPAIDLIEVLAREFGLVLFDLQSGDAHLP